MNCKDFREIADSYLSDELAVETNHEVFKHLENCVNCRQELALRREVRDKICVSMKNSPEFQMNPAFAVNLREKLHEEASAKTAWLNWKIFAPVFATFLLVAVIGFAFLYKQDQNSDLAQSYLVEMSHKAIGDHRHCALEKLKKWQANAGKVSAEKAVFVKSLQTGNTEVLEAHDCIFEGKIFTHYILRRDEKIVSVLKIASENLLQTNTNSGNPIICEREDGLQVASFQNGENMIFVISDMSETENLSAARILSDSLKPQI